MLVSGQRQRRLLPALGGAGVEGGRGGAWSRFLFQLLGFRSPPLSSFLSFVFCLFLSVVFCFFVDSTLCQSNHREKVT